MIIIQLIIFSSVSWSFIQDFQKPYSDYEKISISDPNKALKLLNAHSPKNLLGKLQHLLLLSTVTNDLVYPEESLKLAQSAIELIDNKDQPWLYHSLKIAESYALETSGKAQKGIKGAKAALVWAEKNKHLDLEITAYMSLGYLLTVTANYVSALNNLQKAYEKSNANTKIKKGVVSNLIALVYNERKEYDLAIPYYKEALKYDRTNNNNSVHHSIALFGLGRAYMNVDKIEQGKKLLIESNALSEKLQDIQGVAYAKNELAIINQKEKQYDKAIDLFNESLVIFESSQNKFMLFDVHKNLSEVYLITQQLELAQKHLQKSKLYLNEKSQPQQSIEYEKLSAEVFASQGDFEKAYANLKQTILEENKLVTTVSTQKLHQLRAQFDLDSKEKLNKILSTNNELQNIKLKTQAQKYQVLQLFIVFVLTILILFAVMIYRTRKHKLHFQYVANHDGLTGLYNRNFILDKLDLMFEESKNLGYQFNIIMIDLDNFKNLNDTYGHTTGDHVLKHVAKLFTEHLDDSDLSGRLGGEEFLLIIPHNGIDQALKKIEAIKIKTLKISSTLNLKNCKTSLSAGILNIKNPSAEIQSEDFIKRADKALYKAKSDGRNTIVIA